MFTQELYKKIFLTILLLVASLNASANQPQVLDKIKVIVNNSVILQSEVDKEVAKVKQRLRQMRVAQPPAPQLEKQVIQQMIMQTATLELANKMGITVSEEDFLFTLENIAKSQNASISQLKSQLKSQGESFAEYREDIIKQIKMSRVQQYQIASRIQISDSEINDFLRTSEGAQIDQRQFKLAHILLPLSESPTSNELEEATAQIQAIKAKLNKGADFKGLAIASSSSSTALTGGDLGWLKILEMPTLFAQKVGDMQIGEVVGPLRSSSGLHLIKLLDKRNAKKEVYKQYRMQRIVLIPNKIRDMAQTKKLADSIYAQLKQGKDFASLAKQYSDDLISKQKGGELDWIMPEMLDVSLAARLKSLAKNEISQPLTSKLGWEIWKNLATRNIDLSEESLKGQVRELLFRRKFAEEAEAWSNTMRESLFVEFR